MTDLYADHFCVIRSKMFCGFCLEVQEWQMPFGSCGGIPLNSDGCPYIMVWKKRLMIDKGRL